MFKKFWVLAVIISFMTNTLSCLAATNEPVVGAQAILSTIETNEDGIDVVTPVLDDNGEQIIGTTDAEGKVIFDIPTSFSSHKPLFSVAQPAEGEDGSQLTAFIGPSSITEEGEEAHIVKQDPVAGATTNLVLTMGATASKDMDMKSMDPELLEDIVEGVSETVDEVEPDSTTAGTMSRLATAMGFQVNRVLEEFEGLNISAEDKLKIAVNIDSAAAPDGYNVFASAAPTLPDEAPAGGIYSALIDPSFLEKHAPKDFDFSKQFGDHALTPGSVASDGQATETEPGKKGKGSKKPLTYIPEGTFSMPSDLRLNADKVNELKPGAVLAQGLRIGADIDHLPEGTMPAPGTIFEGDVPAGIDSIPEGVIISAEKRAALEAEGKFKPFALREGLEFRPSPGFALMGDLPAMPAGFGLPEGVEPAQGTKQLPKEEGYKEQEFTDGRQLAMIPEFEAGETLPEGTKFPKGFDPSRSGLVPPSDFVAPRIGVKQDNMDDVKGFDPRAFATNAADFAKPEVKDAIAAEILAGLEAGTFLEEGDEVPDGLYNADGSVNIAFFEAEFADRYDEMVNEALYGRPEDEFDHPKDGKKGPRDGKGTKGGKEGNFDPSSMPEDFNPDDPNTYPEGWHPEDGFGDGQEGEHDGDFPEDFENPDKMHPEDGELGEFDPNGDHKDFPEGVDPNDQSTWPEGFVPPENGENHQDDFKDGDHQGQTPAEDAPAPPADDIFGDAPAGGSADQHHDDAGNAPPPADNGGTNPPPANNPPPAQQPQPEPEHHDDGGANKPAGDSTQRVKAHNKYKTVAKLASEVTTVKVGQRTVLDINTNAKTKKVTASSGVYLIGKAKTKAKLARLPVIIDPSTTSESLKVTLAEADNSVETTNITVENEATELLARLEGNYIEVVADDVSANSVVGYLLAPGTSSSTMQNAITIKGKVTTGDNGDIVSFKLPKKSLEAGSYTVTYEDGDTVYYAKVTIGELKARTVTVQVLAPNGQL